MAQPFDDPFTDDYEYSLPAHPNPLGSHPPPPSRYYKTALRTSEDDAVALSPRSTQTTWSDIELQHRNGTTQEEHDQVAILLEKISPPRWYRKPRNIMLIAVVLLLIVGIAVGGIAAAIYVKRNDHRPSIVPVTTLAVTSTSTRTRSTEATTTTTTITPSPRTANAVTVFTAITAVVSSTVSVFDTSVVRTTLSPSPTADSFLTVSPDMTEISTMAATANTIPKEVSTHMNAVFSPTPTGVLTLPTTLQTIWRTTPPVGSTASGNGVPTQEARRTNEQSEAELGLSDTVSATEVMASHTEVFTNLMSSQVDISTTVTNSQVIDLTQTDSPIDVLTTLTTSQVAISTTLTSTQVDATTAVSSTEVDVSITSTPGEVDTWTTLATSISLALLSTTYSGSP